MRTWEIQIVGKGMPPVPKGARQEGAGVAVWKSDKVVVVKKQANKVGGFRRRSLWSEGPWQRGMWRSDPVVRTQCLDSIGGPFAAYVGGNNSA